MYSDAQFAQLFIEAMARLDSEPHKYTIEFSNGHTGLPRASSLGACSRRQLFELTVEREPQPSTSYWAAWMGSMGEHLVRRTLGEMGYEVTQPDVEHDSFSGHVDGVVGGLDLDAPVVWDNKLRAAYGFKLLVTQGVMADPAMYLQMQAYMLALGLDRAMITLLPHDLSAVKRELKFAKIDLAEPLIQRLWVEASPHAQDILVRRAEDIANAKVLDLMVNREYNPGSNKFPCTYCPFQVECITADMEVQSGMRQMVEVQPLEPEWYAA